MHRIAIRRAALAPIVIFALVSGEGWSQTGIETQRCLTREQLEIEPTFSACPPLVDEASVSDASFVSRLFVYPGYGSYSTRWQGPGYFHQNDYVWNPDTGAYEGPCGGRFCRLYPPGWVQQEHWPYLVGTLLAENVGPWTYSELRNGEVFQSLNFEVRELRLSAVSGADQVGLVDQPLPQPLVLQLESFEGTGIADEVIGWDISGPKGAKGAAVYGIGSGSETNASGIDQATVQLGSKPGTYTVTLNNRRVTRESWPSFTFTAVDDIEDTDPEEEHPDTEEGVGGNAEQCDSVGNPITLSIGNKFQREADLEATGLSPIEFVRYHNSLGFLSRSFSNYWTHSYDRYLELPADPLAEPVKVVRPDGKKINFFWSGSAYEPHPGIHQSLERTPDGWRFTDEEMTIEAFDAEGRLREIVGLNGMRQFAVHDAAGRLIRIESSLGDGLEFEYDRSGRLESVVHSGGRGWAYRYDELGRLAHVDRPDGLTRQYHYEDLRHAYALTGITRGDGRRFATYTYDEQGRATASWHTGGAHRVDIRYGADGERIVVDPLGNATVYQTRIENKRGFLDAISGPLCSQGCGMTDTQYEYDDDGNVVRRTVYGVVTEYGAHDAEGQPGYVIEAAGTPEARRRDFEYAPGFRNRVTRVVEPSVFEGASRITTRSYDSRGNLVAETIDGYDPDGQTVSRTTTWSYEGPYGQLTAIDGPRTDVADVTRYEYYADTTAAGANRARLRAIVDPNGIRVRDDISYSTTGKVLSELRPNGVTLQYEYEPGSDRIVSLTESGGDLFNRTRWAYGLNGELQSITSEDEAGHVVTTRFSYDEAGRLNIIESGDGGGGPYREDLRISYSFDAAGNVIAEEHWSRDGAPAALLIERVFDAHGHLDRLSQGGVTVDFDYHPDGTLAARTDGEGHTTRFGYDAFERLISTERFGQVRTDRAYDVHGNAASVTDPEGHETTYLHDDLGNRVRIDSPDAGWSAYEYNEAGQVVAHTDAKGQTSRMQYDAGGRLLRIDRAAEDYDTDYRYDSCPNGLARLCRTSTGWGHETDYAWNELGELAATHSAAGQVTYAYGPGGRPTAIGYPSGRVVRFALDGSGLARQVRLELPGSGEAVLIDDIRYSPQSEPVGWRLANGLAVDLRLDGRMRTQEIGVPGALSWQAAGYDANDNLLGFDRDGDITGYGYDPLNRLIAAQSAERTLGFSYDDVGNRLSRTSDGSVESAAYAPGSNRMTAFGERRYSFDANGNTTSLSDGLSTMLHYVYSPHNRLLGLVDGQTSADLATYRYDALGQRVEKLAAGQARKFVYGRRGELLAELGGGGRVLHEYVYLGDRLVADLGGLPETGPPQPADAAIIDQDQAVVAGNHWQSKRSADAIGGTYLQNRKRDGVGVYWYLDETGATGNHDIYVRWLNPSGDGSRTSYRVTLLNDAQDSSEKTDIVVDHADAQAGDWVHLGTFYLRPRTNSLRQFVSLTGFDNPYGWEGTFLEADAVRMVPVVVPPGSSELRFIHTDPLGTPLAATDESGQLVWRASYRPFGEAEVDEDPDGDGVPYELNLRFPGQYYDAESGLHYNYFRTYDPELGRFVRPDPAGEEGGLNLYRYADNNPIANSDPLGLWVKRCSRQLGNPQGPNRSADNPIRHDYLVVSGEILSFQAGESWIWSQGRIDTGGEDPDRTCPTVCSDDAFDDFVFEAAATIGAPMYCLVATPGTLGHALGARNCQTWADDVLQLARENYLREIPCPRCFN